MTLKPIGIYRSTKVHPYDAARQPREDQMHEGEIHLAPQQGFEQALIGLEGFERIWLIFQFHKNDHWNPMVMPPRGTDKKIGVFATRAPYRPNSLGMSCVRLKSIQGLKVTVMGADLLDETPIYDIKPYVPESDAFPNAKAGWLEDVAKEKFEIQWSDEALKQVQFLRSHQVTELKDFVDQQLEYHPFDFYRKRVEQKNEKEWILAYRTWRVHFRESGPKTLEVQSISSGYSAEELESSEDKYQDKEIHRQFIHFLKP